MKTNTQVQNDNLYTEELYEEILKEYVDSGYELFDEMFLTQFTYVGGYK